MTRNLLSGERGSGTVTALGIIAVLAMLLGLIAVLSTVATTKSQVERAADLAALAAADTARGLNIGDPCTVAEQVAGHNGAELQHCTVGGEHPTEVTVTVNQDSGVVVISHLIPAMNLSASATSRAGPPEALHGD
ncbi:Rv3654c family TadE-like protein [Nesterenkonia ebinurensis]|uniref:Rv3654c family TadE-like protein n=1 Tax=Nesterenkonia ebinurensis TaxID=2608252 RepID=UPI00123D8F24|nr:Rv3654c family TadE-like protein [Nesterenkonia ebinurensis]